MNKAQRLKNKIKQTNMKIFIQQFISYLLPCFKVEDEVSGGQSLVNATPVPMPIHSPNPTPNPTPNPVPPLGDPIPAEMDLFLVNKPSLYNKMKEEFINYHGIDSDKVNQLISPETDLSDRAFNIHCITGSTGHIPQFLQKTLISKSSLSNMLPEMDISDMISNLSDSTYSNFSTNASPLLNTLSNTDLVSIGIDAIPF